MINSSEQPDDFRDIFRDAIALPKDERDAWISQLPSETQSELATYFKELGDVKAEAMRLQFAPQIQEHSRSTVSRDNFLANIGAKTDLGDYQLVREISSGGMGIVWEAIQQPFGRTVAVKLMKSGQMASSEQRHRFQIEANAVARLNHPCIVQIFEVSEYLGAPFFTMEFVPGGTLEELVQLKRPSIDEAISIVIQIADGVSHAHLHGVLHRDLKPVNVLLTEEQQAKLVDFGIARRLDSPDGPTVTGQVLGTPSYMAPEQASGKTREISEATDVYGLGAILHFVLTGSPPFSGASSAEILQKVVEEPIRDPRSINGAIPEDLAAICLRALEKNPANRYLSAEDFQHDLARYSKGESTLARPRSVAAKIWLTMCSQPFRRIGLVAVGLLLIAVIGSGLVDNLHRAASTEKSNSADAVEATPEPTEFEFNRQVAEELLAIGARFSVFTERGPVEEEKFIYDGPSELTSDPFFICYIKLRTKPSPELISKIRKLRLLGSIFSYGGSPSDEDFANLAGISTLEAFGISSSEVSVVTLRRLAQSPLKQLNFQRCCSNDEALEFICETWPEIQMLSIGDQIGLCDPVSDTSVPYLKRLTQLKQLTIDSVPITDASVPIFAEMSQLERLDIRATRISSEGVAQLRVALPRCEILAGELTQ